MSLANVVKEGWANYRSQRFPNRRSAPGAEVVGVLLGELGAGTVRDGNLGRRKSYREKNIGVEPRKRGNKIILCRVGFLG